MSNFSSTLESATACNCTACRRYGTLWAYGYEGEEIKIVGESVGYCRSGKKPALHLPRDGRCIKDMWF